MTKLKKYSIMYDIIINPFQSRDCFTHPIEFWLNLVEFKINNLVDRNFLERM